MVIITNHFIADKKLQKLITNEKKIRKKIQTNFEEIQKAEIQKKYDEEIIHSF